MEFSSIFVDEVVYEKWSVRLHISKPTEVSVIATLTVSMQSCGMVKCGV